MLHEQEAWLAANRTEIESKINEGYAAAQRGELLQPEEVRARLSERKRVLF
jgi:predicted transcriptional regulator